MPQYDSDHYYPPAPIARVTLKNPATGQTISDVPMLLDTGADVTLIPRSLVERLGIPIELDAAQEYELAGFDGTQSTSVSVKAHMLFQSLTFKGSFLLCKEATGVIGRNVLNRLSITFNGRELSWDLDRS